MKTLLVREIKKVRRENGEVMAFYRFANSRSPVWYSMPLRVAERALQKGSGTWNGMTGPATFNTKESRL